MEDVNAHNSDTDDLYSNDDNLNTVGNDEEYENDEHENDELYQNQPVTPQNDNTHILPAANQTHQIQAMEVQDGINADTTSTNGIYTTMHSTTGYNKHSLAPKSKIIRFHTILLIITFLLALYASIIATYLLFSSSNNSPSSSNQQAFGIQPTSTPTEKLYGDTLPPSSAPTISPTITPTITPTKSPQFTLTPTKSPTNNPTIPPTTAPVLSPTTSPTISPTPAPSTAPVMSPTTPPTISPSPSPSTAPVLSPTTSPTISPTTAPTAAPVLSPTTSPTISPTTAPTAVMTSLDILPSGSILIWTQCNGIPNGFDLCDGTNNTPDLRGKFIIGEDGSLFISGNSGGNMDHSHVSDIQNGVTDEFVLTENEIPAHTHSDVHQVNVCVDISGTGSNCLVSSASSDSGLTGGGQGHSHTFSTVSVNVQNEGHMPPYYVLCYIMKNNLAQSWYT